MTLTVNLDENQSIRVTEEMVDTRPPDRIGFAAEGVVTMTRELLAEFEGTSLNPVGVDISVDDTRVVEIDLEEGASLRLETIDVGVETPDTDDLSPGLDTVRSADDDSEPTGAGPGAIAFTVEGAITDVPTDPLEAIARGSPTVESITFAVEDPVRSDGGPNDVLFEFTLLGYGIAVHRDGTIEIGKGGGVTEIGLP